MKGVFKTKQWYLLFLQRMNLLESANEISLSFWFFFRLWGFSLSMLIDSIFPFISCRKKHDKINICYGLISLFNLIKEDEKMHYQGNLNVSFHQPCLEQFATIISSRKIISKNVGLTLISGCQHSSINL